MSIMSKRITYYGFDGVRALDDGALRIVRDLEPTIHGGDDSSLAHRRIVPRACMDCEVVDLRHTDGHRRNSGE
jgi:hypothetical protein